MFPEPKYNRQLDLPGLLAKKSFFPLGSRATGKSFLIQQQLPNARVYNLLLSRTLARLLTHPELIEEQADDPKRAVVIDEVQKLPVLLDVVHHLIEARGMRVLLTGRVRLPRLERSP